jgi:signal transduction histidine kinase/ligand-binding sensor domain-containing protein/DNA-binding response OmpR family regulator
MTNLKIKSFFLKYALCILATFAFNFSAQSQKLKFEHITVEEGLQNNIVLATTQDEKGFMWFGTVTGIDRYDGSKFVNYPLPTNNNTLTDFLQIPFLTITKSKTLWVASANNVFTYNVKLDKFENATIINNKIPPTQTVTAILADSDGSLWVGLSNSLLKYNEKTKTVLVFSNIKFPLRSLFQDNKNTIWASTDKGVLSFVEKNNSIIKIETDIFFNNEISNVKVSIVSQDKRNRYWFATAEKGLLVFDNNSFTKVSLPQSASRSYTVKDIHHDNNAQTYISLDGGGLILLDENLQVKSISQTNEDSPTTLSNNGVYDIFEDKYNRIWVTTYGGGVNIINTIAQPFTNLSHEINNSNSLSNNMAKAVTEDKLGNLWFGTRKGVSKLNVKDNNWKHFNEETKSPSFTSDNILALTCDNDNRIWVGTFGGGLVKILQDGSVFAYTKKIDDSASIGSDFIFAVLADSKRRIWCGGIRGPLSFLDQTTKKFKQIIFNVNNIKCIIEDTDGEILVGTEKGVFIISNDLQVRRLNLNFPKNSFGTDKVITILEYKPGEIWIGTQGGGVIIANKKGTVINVFKTNDGLSADIICGLHKDVNGDVWISTSKGITHYQTDTKTFTSYSKADGLAASQFNYGASCYTKNGNLIFGSTNGFTIFNPLDIKMSGYRPNIFFTDFSINNKYVTPGDEESPIKEQIDELKIVNLKYFQNSFAIDFISTSPAVSGKHLYSWKLEGFDKDWSPLSTIPSAIYTNLNSGKYTLLVKAFAKGQKTNDSEIRKIEIVIKSPWWKSIWAYLLYLLIVAAGIYTTYNFYQIKRAKKNYADRLKLNTTISHEIRTPLTLIKGPVSTLANSNNLNAEDKNNLKLAERNIEKLEALISQFIDYQKTGMSKMQMQVVRIDLVAFLEDIINSFIPLIDAKEINFKFDKPSKPIILLFDKEKMEKIFNNLISNAIKYTNKSNSIHISILQNNKEAIVHVSDTGIGIPEKQQRFIFKGYYRADNTINLNEAGSGIGLNVAKELVELHKGNLTFVSSENKGTVFTMTIPLANEMLENFLVIEKKEELPTTTKKTKLDAHKILVVEDNDDLRTYFSKELIIAGYRVFYAINGKVALDIANKNSIDLVITDVVMPEMNGFQLCTALKKDIRTCHIPVIMLTAIHDKDYLLQGYKSGADDYVKKPFDLSYILTRIENLLQNKIRFQTKVMSVFEQNELVFKTDGDLVWLKHTTEVILQNMDQVEFSLEKLSSILAISPSLLFRKFKSITGESPQQFIHQIRLRRAVELLQLREHNLNEIAYMIGYSDPQYFSTAFKKHFGKSPREYLQDRFQINDEK